MISSMRRVLLNTGCLLMLAATAGAVQTQVMVQGFLTNATGTPYTTTQTTEFRVYQGGNANTAGSGTLYYDETASVTPSASGVFTYALGSGSPTVPFLVIGAGATVANALSTTTFDTTQAVYLEISVGGVPLLPRLQLLGTPYAALAGAAESLKPTGQISTINLAASSATVAILSVGAGTFNTIIANSFSGAHFGDGSGLYNVNAASVSAAHIQPGTLPAGVLVPVASLINGPIPPSMLSSTIAYTTQPNTFSQTQSFPGGVNGSTAAFTTLQVATLNANALAGPFTVPAPNISSGSLALGVQVHPESLVPGPVGPGVLLPVSGLVNGPIPPIILPPTLAYTTQQSTFTQTQFFPGGINGSTASFNTLAVGTLTATALSGSFTVPAGNIGSGPLSPGVQLPVASLINGPIPASLLPPGINVGNALKANLLVRPNLGAPQTKVDVNADLLSVQGVSLTGVAVSANILATGVNGRDGGTLQNNTWYAVHVISDNAGATVASLLSVSGTNPTLPAGYTKFRRVGWIVIGGSGSITQFQTQGDWTYFIDATQFSYPLDHNGTYSFAKAVPPTSHLVAFTSQIGSWIGVTGILTMKVTGTAQPATWVAGTYNSGNSINIGYAQFTFPTDPNQQIDMTIAGNYNGPMIVCGYYDPL